ncbi:hypothetical protein P8C59_008720 [Phyllachora maydis]|nr:hypothetical protein P8C59_008720 [Phyllachora maydis]
MADLARAGRARDLARTLALGQVDGELLSLTAVDISSDMLRVARQHLRDTVPGLDRIMHRQRREPMPDGRARDAVEMVVDVLDHRLRLIKADAQEVLPPPPAIHGVPPPVDGKYDTVIQTFGLCSVEDPSKLLAKMAAAVRPDTGRILLIEHGRGSYDFINKKLLDRFAQRHFQRYGCWWNRDIAATLEQATEDIPGLEIVSLERPNWYHAGTTMLIELKVNSALTQSREGIRATSKTGWTVLWDRMTGTTSS